MKLADTQPEPVLHWRSRHLGLSSPLISNLVIGVDSTMSVIGLLHLQFLTV